MQSQIELNHKLEDLEDVEENKHQSQQSVSSHKDANLERLNLSKPISDESYSVESGTP